MLKIDLIKDPKTVEDRLINIDKRLEHLTQIVYGILGLMGVAFAFLINN